MEEPTLVSSELDCALGHAGHPFEVRLYRMNTDTVWVLEVVDENGTSHVYDERYATDTEGLAVARADVLSGELTAQMHDSALMHAMARLHLPEVQLGLARTPAYAFGRFTASLTGPDPRLPERVLDGLIAPRGGKAEQEAIADRLIDVLEATAKGLADGCLSFPMLADLEALGEWAVAYTDVVAEDALWLDGNVFEADLLPIAKLASQAKTGFDEDAGEVPELADAKEELVAAALGGYDAWVEAREAQSVGPEETFRRDVPKVGRNAPCPCGSGKKYKKCCLQK